MTVKLLPQTPPLPGKEISPRPTDHTLVCEHAVLIRQLASLQRRWGEQSAEQAARERRLDAEVVRLRGRLLQARTALLWGVGTRPAEAAVRSDSSHEDRVLPAPSRFPGAFPEADAVLCQTACSGHAHPWRTAEGWCQRTGELCRTDAAKASGAIGSGHQRPDANEALSPDKDHTLTRG